MTKLIRVMLGSLVVSSGFMGCERRTDNLSSVSDEKAVATAADVENRIKARLDADDQLKASNLSVKVNEVKRVATLSGTVASESLAAKAIKLAQSAENELMIEDHIVVTPSKVSRRESIENIAMQELPETKELRKKLGDRIEDAWIHGKIVAKLIASSKIQERAIDVDVVNNDLTVRGTLKNAAQKSETEQLAKETDGVKSVYTSLTSPRKANSFGKHFAVERLRAWLWEEKRG